MRLIKLDRLFGPLTCGRIGLWLSTGAHIGAAVSEDAVGRVGWAKNYVWGWAFVGRDNIINIRVPDLAVGVTYHKSLWGKDAHPAYLTFMFLLFDLVIEFYPRKMRTYYGQLGGLQPIQVEAS